MQQTIGQEVIRVNSGSVEAQEIKQKFAKLFDEVTELAMKAQTEIDTPPSIYSDESINKHMALCKKNEEATRCYAKACELIELAAMWAVKGMTA